MTLRRALLSVAVFATAIAPARLEAQSVGLDFEAGYRSLAASKSAQAVFGKDGGVTFGGSLQYEHARGPFARVGLRSFSLTGEKVFLENAGSTVYPLGFPLEARIRSIDLIVGWRLRLGTKKRPSPFVPYAGLGLDLASYEEESTVAGLLERTEESKTGFQFVAGLEYRLPANFSAAAELGYSSVNGVLGLGGVSQIYGEDGIGGVRVMGRLGYRFPLGKKRAKPAVRRS
jgi:opacity protein-like surface antigen